MVSRLLDAAFFAEKATPRYFRWVGPEGRRAHTGSAWSARPRAVGGCGTWAEGPLAGPLGGTRSTMAVALWHMMFCAFAIVDAILNV